MLMLLGAHVTLAATFDDAVRALSRADTWCAGAETLGKMGRADALVPLVAAYDTNVESNRRCLLDAIKSIAKAGGVEELWRADDAAGKRAALRAMHLVADARFVPLLAQAVRDPRWEPLALPALVGQWRDEAWESAMIALLDAPSRSVRAEAIRCLSGRKGDKPKAALRAHVSVEKDEELRRALRDAAGE